MEGGVGRSVLGRIILGWRLNKFVAEENTANMCEA